MKSCMLLLSHDWKLKCSTCIDDKEPPTRLFLLPILFFIDYVKRARPSYDYISGAPHSAALHATETQNPEQSPRKTR